MDDQRGVVLPPNSDALAGEFNFTRITCGEEKIARLGLGGGKIAEEAADVVLDAQRDFAAEEVLSELGHRQIDDHVLLACLAGQLPEQISVVSDDDGDRAIESTPNLLDLREAVELANLRRASQ